MKNKSYITTKLLCLILLSSTLGVVSCVGPIALKNALPAYDETIRQLQTDSLLINIARTRHNTPIHFTRTTNIAATFNFTVSAGFGADITTSSGPLPSNTFTTLRPSLTTSASESPTIGLVPLQGEEFTKRILNPLDDNKFELLVRQGFSLDMIIRLMGNDFKVMNYDGMLQRYVQNNPDYPNEYEEFRRLALHLSLLHESRNLVVRRLRFDKTLIVKLPGPPPPGYMVEMTEKGYSIRQVDNSNVYELTKTVLGNIVVTNYEPKTTLSSSELQTLNAIAVSQPTSAILVDIRPGYPGGDYPIFGSLQLRSLNKIVTFIAAGISESPEYHVDMDSRSRSLYENHEDPSTNGNRKRYVLRNPVRVLAIQESQSPPVDGVESVYYKGAYYYVPNTQWDRQAFNCLFLLFSMSTQAVTERGFPITISK